MVLVSHDMRLISQVAKEIWICDHKTVAKYNGSIEDFKMDMRTQLIAEEEIAKKKALRGDASIKKKADGALPPKKEKPKKQTLDVVPPPRKTNGGRSTEDDDDAATAATSTTTSSFDTDAMRQSLPSAASDGAPKRYVPPHLRKKMAT